MRIALRLLRQPARGRRLRSILLHTLALGAATLGLAGASVSIPLDYVVLVDFQGPGAPLPAAHLADGGQPFGPRGDGAPSYGWVAADGRTPLALDAGSALAPGASPDLRLDTALTTAAAPGAAWEIQLPNGRYQVTAAGRALGPAGENPLLVEGTRLGGAGPATGTVMVADGRLTVSAPGGRSFAISYIEIATARPRPAVAAASPGPGRTGVPRDTPITLSLQLPDGLDARTVDSRSVSLVRERDGAPMPAQVIADATGARLSVRPKGFLDADTTYRLSVTPRLQARNGIAAAPFSVLFTTGRAGGPRPGPDGLGFDVERNLVRAAPGALFTGVVVGPGHMLYVSTLSGEILREAIRPDGGLGAPETIATLVAHAGKRAIIGMAFDPAATAANPILWVGHNDPQYTSGAADWSGRISRLSGPRLEYIQDYVVNLPHSYKDHMVNGLSFGPDGALYILVGGNSAMGSPDKTWGWRPEHLLGAALLRLDPAAVAQPPLDAKTEEGGSYDPYAPGAPLTLYATGLRNAYDMVWHANGALYVPTNGSAAGGDTPATPAGFADEPACVRRGYRGPAVPAVTKVENQDDWLFRVEAGGYYGHPNPRRCEWVAHGGNPTAGDDLAQIAGYPVGTAPDPNWRGPAFDFGPNRSANGIIEYGGAAFGGRLRGALIATQYSTDDLVVLWPGGPRNDIVAARTAIPGLTDLSKPLDLAEDPATGNLYVVEFGPPSMISLLRPLDSAGGM